MLRNLNDIDDFITFVDTFQKSLNAAFPLSIKKKQIE